MKSSTHTRAVLMAKDDLDSVIESFKDDVPFMRSSVDKRTAERRALFEKMAPDLQQMLSEGFPQEMVEKLARKDQES